MNKNMYIFGIGIAIVVFIGGIFAVTSFLRQRQSAPVSQNQEQTSQPTRAGLQPSEIKTVENMEKPQKQWNTQPAMSIDKAKTYIATLRTSKGDIVVALNAKETPVTVNNFVFLAKNGFYANTTFHRVIKGFMIQGGDPLGNGAGGPGYSFNDEKFSGEYDRGVLAMANAGPNTNGSQFFIMHQSRPLPKDYVIFGAVTKGLDVVDAIADTDVESSDSGEPSKPVIPITMSSVTIAEK
jgi:peptidylprolyl isomerase